tara:strand:- start:443 stop:1543 length:1101 start_codon:yes stop_codon:yes gene_type:complete
MKINVNNKKMKMKINKIFAILLICILLYCIFRNTKKQAKEHFTEPKDTTPNVSFPFKNIYDDKDRKLPIICIGAPFRNDEHKKQYEEYKKQGNYFLGSASYQEFPGEIKNPYEDPYYKKHNDDYESMTTAWIHCFREPNNYFKTNIPKLLMSESDFIDPEQLKPTPNTSKKYDFMYVCLDEGLKHESTKCIPGWQAHNRNWDLAKECLKILCGDFHLKGLIIGRTNCTITEKCNTYITSVPFQPQSKFFELLQECKWIFVPNISDASPRVVTQAMCYNMPVLMNKNIVGGWKYIDENHTGTFFTNEHDLSQSLQKFLRYFSIYKPREWYMKRYGKNKSGKQLLHFLKKYYHQVDFKDAEYAFFKRL